MVICIAGRWSVFSSDLYYRKTGILYDHIADIEHNYIRVWISGFYERGKYLKYLQCNCFSFFDNNSDSADIFWTDIMLTGLGAIMDVAVTISAATGEIVRKNPDVSLRKLIHSGREIGYDIMGTMINVLLFVLASGMIPMFILKMNNEIRSIGIVLAIPVSVFISSIIMKLPSLKRSDKK